MTSGGGLPIIWDFDCPIETSYFVYNPKLLDFEPEPATLLIRLQLYTYSCEHRVSLFNKYYLPPSSTQLLCQPNLGSLVSPANLVPSRLHRAATAGRLFLTTLMVTLVTAKTVPLERVIPGGW